MSRIKISLIMTAILLITAFGVAFAADSTIVGGYQFHFLGAVDNIDGTSTWQYAVSGPDSWLADNVKGLSHFTLGLDIGTCGGAVVTPLPPGPYTTLANDNYGYCASVAGTPLACRVATYPLVELGADASVPYGIRFADASNNNQDLALDDPGTHIFEFTLSGIPAGLQGTMPLNAKVGNTNYPGSVTGATCTPDPSAISLSAVNVSDGTGNGLFVVSLALLGVLLVATAAVWRRQTA